LDIHSEQDARYVYQASKMLALQKINLNIWDAPINISLKIIICFSPNPTYKLLGVIPMEELGLQPDIINQRLILLPQTGKDTYHTIL
ncbi:MAG: hypothetical protein SWZ49_20450, partial [Cyanobacteriota bacterium]|nr:hypothetical protein [Cyanobacteriota bacterium]